MEIEKKKHIISFSLGIIFLILAGCAAPFKTTPSFEKEKDQINSIALYPLHFSQDGKEQRLFGLTFSSLFYEGVRTSEFIRPIQIFMPDSTLIFFDQAGIEVKNTVRGIVDQADVATEYPVYRKLTPTDLSAISENCDGLLFCDLINYNEVGAGEALAEAAASACLTMGMASYSEQNYVNMKISLFSTKTDSLLWIYTPYLSGGLGEQRTKFTDGIVNGFRKYLPLSTAFKQKK